jgi:hypothetical protein
MRYEIPHGFSEEIHWFKFFTARSLLVMLGTAAPGVLLFRFFLSIGAAIPFVIIWICLVIIATATSLAEYPGSRWLKGGGEHIDQVFLKCLIRRRKRCLYIKGYNQQKYDEEEKNK